MIQPLPWGGGGMGWAGGSSLADQSSGGRRCWSGVVPHTRVLFCGGKSNLSEAISLGSESEVCFILGDWHEIHST